LGNQYQWHNLFSSQADYFSAYVFMHIILKAKALMTKGKTIQSFFFYSENINFFPLHINALNHTKKKMVQWLEYKTGGTLPLPITPVNPDEGNI
jgi:hypothetical protein